MSQPVSQRELFRRWFPLVISRACIAAEHPIVAFWVAKFAAPELNLQAVSGLLIPLGWLFECPVWMLLSVSAALVSSRENYQTILNFLFWLSVTLALLFYSLLFLPGLSDFIFGRVFSAPAEVISAARPGLILAGVWPCVVGYRRIGHGILVRVGQSRVVTATSAVRVLFLLIGFPVVHALFPHVDGLFAGALFLTLAIFLEAGCVGYAVRRFGLSKLPDREEQLTFGQLREHCFPLIFASLITNLTTPIGSAMMFRMPDRTLSLTIWPALSGLFNLLRTPSYAFSELTSSIGKNAEHRRELEKLCFRVTLALIGVTTVFAIPSVGVTYLMLWGNLSEQAARFALPCLALNILCQPAVIVFPYLYGLLNALRRTKLYSEATTIGLLLYAAAFLIGTHYQPTSGAVWVIGVILVTDIVEVSWIAFRLRAQSTRQCLAP